MRKTVYYAPPAILKESALYAETPVLAGSFVDTVQVRSMGQDVKSYNMQDEGFNHHWE